LGSRIHGLSVDSVTLNSVIRTVSHYSVYTTRLVIDFPAGLSAMCFRGEFSGKLGICYKLVLVSDIADPAGMLRRSYGDVDHIL